MSRPRTAFARLTQAGRLSAWTLVLASPTLAQEPPLYPAVNLPAAVEAPASDIGAAISTDAAAQAASDFDATHFTPSPNLMVRDLDGDGHLDGTALYDGLTTWKGQGDGRLDPGVFQQTGLSATSLMTGQWGDVNGDGRLDAIFLSDVEYEVFSDDGGGSFSSFGPQEVADGSQYSFTSWSVADMNGDGRADIVARGGGTGYELRILYGQTTPGHGWFSAPELLTPLLGIVWETGLGDLDGNGLCDAVTVIDGATTDSLKPWLQTAPGVFVGMTAAPFPFTSADRIEIRDVTGDGLSDVVVSAYGLRIYVGDGSGNLPATPVTIAQVEGPTQFADVDGDGLVDLLYRKSSPPYGPAVLLARADGELSTPVHTLQAAEPLGLGDFDEDGVLDLWSQQALMLGRGDGGFAAARNFPIGAKATHQRQLTFADFNEDGVPDLGTLDDATGIFATISKAGASWRSPQGVIPTMASVALASGDLNGDGHLDLIASRIFAGNADYCLGNGSGGFQTFPTSTFIAFSGPEKTGIGIGQFDLAAPADVVACSNDSLLSSRLGQGGLVFGPIRITNLPAGPGGAPWLLVRDLDQDGLDDVIVILLSGTYSLRCVGNGNFAPAVLLDASPAHGASLADVDGDGDDDLLLSSNDPFTETFEVHTLLGDGAGNFAPAPFAAITGPAWAFGTAVADVDDDGLLDLAVGHERSWSLRLGAAGGGWSAEPDDHFDLSGAGHLLRFLDANIDGKPDLLAAGTDFSLFPDDQVGLTLALHQDGPWHDLGYGLTGNTSPLLSPQGSLVGGTPFAFVLGDGAPGATGWFVFGLGELLLPFKGGVLVPLPQFLLPAALNGSGSASLGGTWPMGVPAGVQLWAQTWIADLSGPAGFTASNAVVGTTP